MYKEELLEEIRNYIGKHLCEEITLAKIGDAICYSAEHTSRFFKEQTGENLFDYIRDRRLLHAAGRIRRGEGKIIDVALDCGFNSHEVFTRSFSAYYGISPKRFRTLKPEIKHFMPRGFKVFPLEHREKEMENFVIFTQILQKEERQLLLIRGKKATEYFGFCEEAGCDVWGKLLEVKDSLYEPVGLWMPEKFRPAGTSEYVQGVEVPLGYNGKIPEGCESITLPAGLYLLFQSQPYEESDERMMEVIQAVQKAIQDFKPEHFGFQWAPDEAPRYQLAPLGERGYIEALPVKKISS